MRSSTRVLLPAVLTAAVASACSSSGERGSTLPPASRRAGVVATFEGRYDAATGAVTFTTAPSAATGAESLVPWKPWSDGHAGTNPKNTFELRNGTVLGAGTACPGGAASWEGEVVLASFFDTQAFSDVAVELVDVQPSGNEACSGDAAYGGMSAHFGLWGYGPIGAGGTATRTWRFANPVSQSFTFRGRIMARLAAIPAPPNGPTSFEWSPYLFADPPHAFQHQTSTLAHVVWNGSSFVDLEGKLDFVAQGAAAADHAVGISYPAQHWAGPFADGANRYVATDTIGLVGDFTACVKFKPGADPAVGDRKVLVAKGNAVDAAEYGWAITQQHGATQQYGIWYYSPGQGNSYDTFDHPGSDHPEVWDFDYVCGGRDGTNARVVNHGRDIRFPLTVVGTLPAGIPLAIGAEANGLWPAADAGVYEVIFDRRPISLEVAAEIVGLAEGRIVADGAAYRGNDVDALPVVGADGATYHFPFGATAPVSSDGSGLVDAGTILKFGGTNAGLGGFLAGHPTSFCVGAEVASANWAAAIGGVFGDVDGALKLFLDGSGFGAATGGQYRAAGGDYTRWVANSRHELMVCTAGPTDNIAVLYVDGAPTAQTDPADHSAPLNLTTSQIFFGTAAFATGDLTNARIGRVFACPTNDAASCR